MVTIYWNYYSVTPSIVQLHCFLIRQKIVPHWSALLYTYCRYTVQNFKAVRDKEFSLNLSMLLPFCLFFVWFFFNTMSSKLVFLPKVKVWRCKWIEHNILTEWLLFLVVQLLARENQAVKKLWSMDASVHDYSVVSSVIFLPFFIWENWKVGVRILHAAKHCIQHWLSSCGYPVLQLHIITLHRDSRHWPFFSPKLSYKLSFHKAEHAAPVIEEFTPNLLYFYQTNITMGLSNPYRICGELLVVVFSFCALQIGV